MSKAEESETVAAITGDVWWSDHCVDEVNEIETSP